MAMKAQLKMEIGQVYKNGKLTKKVKRQDLIDLAIQSLSKIKDDIKDRRGRTNEIEKPITFPILLAPGPFDNIFVDWDGFIIYRYTVQKKPGINILPLLGDAVYCESVDSFAAVIGKE